MLWNYGDIILPLLTKWEGTAETAVNGISLWLNLCAYRHLMEDSQLIAEVYLLRYIILNGNCSSTLEH